MELRVLNYFLTVAREGNITRAAKTLHITQPTLSRQIQQLEEELDAQLFIRGKHHITLTSNGMLLKRRAEELLTLANKTLNEFSIKEETLIGEIFIASGETEGFHEVSKLMKPFHIKYPEVKFNLLSGDADDIKDRIDNGIADIGLVHEPVDISKYDFIRLPFKEIWGVIMPKDSPLANHESINLKDLLKFPILFSRRDTVQKKFRDLLGEDFEKLNIIATFNLIYNANIMVEDHLGYAVTISGLVPKDSNLIFVPLSPKIETNLLLIWKKYQTFSPATSKFLEEIKKAFSV